MAKRVNVWLNVEEVKKSIAESKSSKEVLEKLGRPINTSSYQQIRRFATEHNIVLPKLSFEDYSNANKKKIKIPLSDIFIENSPASRSVVKGRIISDKLLEYKCYGPVCSEKQIGLENWNNLVLQLEHKNGIGDDNRLENLEFLCPNCHSLTKTFGSGNKTRYENGAHGTCVQCHRVSKTKFCHACRPDLKESIYSYSLESIVGLISKIGFKEVANKFSLSEQEFKKALQKKIDKIIIITNSYEPVFAMEPMVKSKKKVDYPDIDILVDRVTNEGYTRVARDLGASDNALRSHMKKVLNGNLPAAKYGSRKQNIPIILS